MQPFIQVIVRFVERKRRTISTTDVSPIQVISFAVKHNGNMFFQQWRVLTNVALPSFPRLDGPDDRCVRCVLFSRTLRSMKTALQSRRVGLYT